ncbi:MAG: hypothetical protein DRI01_09265 [Chloroflexi bacterium]|nr:MAG: hypothetical protein DRI01_09265 [Chloroflexota bacterium]
MINFFKKKEKEPENITELLKQFKELKEQVKDISERIKSIEEKSKWMLQKIGIVRFNPFRDMGGNQSFSLAILDGNNTGVVITSLYTKEGNRFYAKAIKEGQSEYPLSQEEKKAIENAINSQGSQSIQ